jgi:hypothetical protein
MEVPMKFEYELKFWDYYWYSLSHVFHSSVTQIFYLIIAVFISYRLIAETPLLFVLFVVFGFGVMWLAQAIFTLIYLSVGKNKNILTKHTLVFDESGIDAENAFGKGAIFRGKAY